MGQGEESRDEAVDLEVLREATAGDRDLMQELAGLYLGDTDLQLRALDDALENKEVDRLKRIGRSMKDASEGVGANAAAEIFARLEAAAVRGDLEAIRTEIDAGRREFARVQKALADLR